MLREPSSAAHHDCQRRRERVHARAGPGSTRASDPHLDIAERGRLRRSRHRARLDLDGRGQERGRDISGSVHRLDPNLGGGRRSGPGRGGGFYGGGFYGGRRGYRRGRVHRGWGGLVRRRSGSGLHRLFRLLGVSATRSWRSSGGRFRHALRSGRGRSGGHRFRPRPRLQRLYALSLLARRSLLRDLFVELGEQRGFLPGAAARKHRHASAALPASLGRGLLIGPETSSGNNLRQGAPIPSRDGASASRHASRSPAWNGTTSASIAATSTPSRTSVTVPSFNGSP